MNLNDHMSKTQEKEYTQLIKTLIVELRLLRKALDKHSTMTKHK